MSASFSRPERLSARLSTLVSGVSFALAIAVLAFPPTLLPVAYARVPSQVTLPGHEVSTPPEARAVPDTRRAHDAEPVTLTFVLRRDRQAEFEAHLRSLYDPLSTNYRRYLSQSEIADRFGPSRETYDRLQTYLRTSGFTVVEDSQNRLTLTVRGTRRAAEHTFDVRLRDFRLGERTYFANDRDPSLPADIAPSVEAITGLSTLARARVAHAPLLGSAQGLEKCATSTEISGSQLACGIGYFFVAVVYDLLCIANTLTLVGGLVTPCSLIPLTPPSPSPAPSPSLARGTAAAIATGAGQKIGLLQFSSFRRSDVEDFFALAGVPLGRIDNLHEVAVAGGAPLGPNQTEALLDINAVMLVAPNAEVTVYHAPFAGAYVSFQRLFNRMLDDGMTIISNSWAYCENQTTSADVHSIDSIFQSAAAAGVSVFNASGDTGSTCLNGSPNTVAVPAGAPHATAVGGTSVEFGAGGTYASETHWNGTAATPPHGEGGYGVSRFFPRPSYQNGFHPNPNRSVPDIALSSDPAAGGLYLCEADAGGCPTGLLYGGTSVSAPFMAAFTALMNEARGSPLGFLNPLLYPLSGTDAFHDPASLGSDFERVGLGSPNVSALHLQLLGQTAGVPDADQSLALAMDEEVAADGIASTRVVVQLRDQPGSAVAGKSVSLTANPGASVVISPPSAISTVDNGSAVFEVTNLVAETVSFTATDTTDGIVLAAQPEVIFGVPPAASAGIAASTGSLPADGVSTATVTVTLLDSLGRGTPNKEVVLSQGPGHSFVVGPASGVTDANGEIVFAVSNRVAELVTYTAVIATDGNIPVPGSAAIDFTGGVPLPCPLDALEVAPGADFAVTDYVTGFPPSLGACLAPSGMAFDRDGNLYVAHFAANALEGGIYKFGPGGGTAGPEARLNATPYAAGTNASGLAFSKDGEHLYLARQFGGGFNGDIVEVDTTDGSVLRTLATKPCATGLATDPISGDLFFGVPCPPPTASNDVVRIHDPESANPTTSVFASPGLTGQFNFAADGTLFVEAFSLATGQVIVKIDGTASATPGAVTELTARAPFRTWSVLPAANPTDPENPPFLLADTGTGFVTLDPSVFPAAESDALVNGAGTSYAIAGPDGCAYAVQSDRIVRISAADGTCPFSPSAAAPAIQLTPAETTPNPAQGDEVVFVARVSNVEAPEGTPVLFEVSGANRGLSMVRTNADGVAQFALRGRFTGHDVLTARADVGGELLVSNPARVDWEPGNHTTFLTLNPSPKSSIAGNAVLVKASLTDSSVVPSVAIPNAEIDFRIGSVTCSAPTNADGIAECSLAPTDIELTTLTADFSGDVTFLQSSASAEFNVLGDASLDHFMTYKTKPTSKEDKLPKIGPVTLTDSLGSGDYDVLAQKSLGLPADKNGEGISDPETHLALHPIKPVKGSPKFQKRSDVRVLNQCGEIYMTLKKPESLLVPTRMDFQAPTSPPLDENHNLDHFLCYKVGVQKKLSSGVAVSSFPKGVQVDVADALESRRFDLKKPKLLCYPTAKAGTPTVQSGPERGTPYPIASASIRNPNAFLTCYTAKLAKKRIAQNGCAPETEGDKGTTIVPKQAKHNKRSGLHVANQLQVGQVDSKKEELLCIPSTVSP